MFHLSVKELVPNGYPNREGVRRRPRDYDRAWIVINSELAARAQDAQATNTHVCLKLVKSIIRRQSVTSFVCETYRIQDFPVHSELLYSRSIFWQLPSDLISLILFIFILDFSNL